MKNFVSRLIKQLFIYFIMGSSLIAAPATAMSLPEFETQEYKANWGLNAINASMAYAKGWTGKGVLIGILDDGYDSSHIDLAAQVFVDGSDAVDVKKDVASKPRFFLC